MNLAALLLTFKKKIKRCRVAADQLSLWWLTNWKPIDGIGRLKSARVTAMHIDFSCRFFFFYL
jgi:hypothetical protein